MRHKTTTITTETKAVSLATQSSGAKVPPTKRSFYETLFDEIEPGWDNPNLQPFDYEGFLRREGLV